MRRLTCGDSAAAAAVPMGAGGGFESHDQYTAHLVRTDNFAVKDGIIKRWYGETDENGQMVWHGHEGHHPDRALPSAGWDTLTLLGFSI